MLVAGLQVAALLLVLGYVRGAGEILLLCFGVVLLMPWFWASMLGLFIATKEDDS